MLRQVSDPPPPKPSPQSKLSPLSRHQTDYPPSKFVPIHQATAVSNPNPPLFFFYFFPRLTSNPKSREPPPLKVRDGGRTDFPNPVVNRPPIRLSINASKLRQTSQNLLTPCECPRCDASCPARMLIKMYFYLALCSSYPLQCLLRNHLQGNQWAASSWILNLVLDAVLLPPFRRLPLQFAVLLAVDSFILANCMSW